MTLTTVAVCRVIAVKLPTASYVYLAVSVAVTAATRRPDWS